MELKGISAIITGSTGKLGQAITVALAKAGCDCICHYNTQKRTAEELVEKIEKMQLKAVAVQADLKKPDEIEKLFCPVQKIQTPQILINSASVFQRIALKEITSETIEQMLSVNMTAAILTSKIFAEKIRNEFATPDSVVGKIMNISDVGGIRPWKGYVTYCCSKAGVNGVTKALAKELAPAICVNGVAIGMAYWPDNTSEEEKQKQLSLIPMGRIAQADEITKTIIFLLESDYITGQIVNVDGGRCI